MKKVLASLLRTMADAVESDGVCDSTDWQKVSESVSEILDNKHTMTEEQYNELSNKLISIQSTMGHLYDRVRSLEKEDRFASRSARQVKLKVASSQ